MRRFMLFPLILLGCGMSMAEKADKRTKLLPEGVLIWQENGSEVALFGVNYYAPFTPDYGLMKHRSLDPARAVREDVSHFQRLGLTAIRLHCFDRQISDREGNLLENEQVQLLDLLISECKKRGIYTVLTPIAWWPPKAGGFSDRFTMFEMTSSQEARTIQCRYLVQFMNHLNPYTHLPYKEDPAIVCIELINEPRYPSNTKNLEIVQYIDALTQAVRSTGCGKPIFYHAWLGDKAQTVSMSQADGASFGWYPTGLVSGRMLKENYLGQVEDYPEMRVDCLKAMPKIVYEFDAADVQGRVMYPAMARAFRSGGCQIATQFQYDPACLADTNQNWQTHYLNLLYTPGKALSFAIAAEVFRNVPRLSAFPPYPQGGDFDGFRIDFENDLSQWVSEETFLYANDTDTPPPHPDKLLRIAGCGSSPAIHTQGTGAYFLDRQEEGVWRLQVYPDAVLVADPYEGGAHEKTRLVHAEHKMTVKLPDLDETFQYAKLSRDLKYGPFKTARKKTCLVSPGEYILVRSDLPPPDPPTETCLFPEPSSGDPVAWCELPKLWRREHPLTIHARVPAKDASVRLRVGPALQENSVTISMKERSSYRFEGRVPSSQLRGEALEIQLEVSTAEGKYLFPGARPSPDEDAVFASPQRWELIKVNEATDPSHLRLEGGVHPKISLQTEGVRRFISLQVDGFPPEAECASAQWPVQSNLPPEAHPSELVLVAKGGRDTSAVEVSLAQGDGKVFGAVSPLLPEWDEIRIPLEDLKPLWWGKGGTKVDLSQLDHVNFTFGSWLFGEWSERPHTVSIESLTLCEERSWWTVPLRPSEGPVIILQPAGLPVHPQGHPVHLSRALGMERGSKAFRATVKGFGNAPDCTSFRWPLGEEMKVWRDRLKECDTLRVKARAAFPFTTCLELVLSEEDGSPWGVDRLELGPKWRDISLPLSELRYFSHWTTQAKGRGKEGDRFHPEKINAVNLCFGAWLYGRDKDQTHGFEIQEISLSNSKANQRKR